MNGKDIVAIIMAVNKTTGPHFTDEDEDVSVCLLFLSTTIINTVYSGLKTSKNSTSTTLKIFFFASQVQF